MSVPLALSGVSPLTYACEPDPKRKRPFALALFSMRRPVQARSLLFANMLSVNVSSVSPAKRTSAPLE